MRWSDRGYLLGFRKYGDKNLILSFITKDHGKKVGLTKVPAKVPVLQVMNCFDITWSSRSAGLGYISWELSEAITHWYMYEDLKVLAVASLAGLLEKILPENECHSKLYAEIVDFVNSLKNTSELWKKKYINVEINILSQLGFAMDLSKCAVSSSTDDLMFISPKTSRAVSREVGSHYAKKLLPLPNTLYEVFHNVYNETYDRKDLQDSLKVTGYFLYKHLLLGLGLTLPKTRNSLIELIG